jgi:TRAP-type C4-dicarboxylate transport system substrate-binding protein
MRKRLPFFAAILLIGWALAAAPFSTAQAKSDKPIVLSFNHLFPEVAWMHTKVVVPWKNMVEQKTNGKVKINLYPGCALAKPGTMYDAVKAGTIDICLDPGPYYIGRFPMSEATQLPFLGAHSSWAASRAWMDLYNEFPELRKEYADTHLLWLFSQGPGQIFSSKPVRTMEDMKGLIVRAPGGIGEIVKALGGSPVSMPAPECYLALSKGTIDATIFPCEAIKTWKLHEVTKYMTIGDFYVQWFWVAMNKKKYDSLPDDVKKVIDECSGSVGADLVGKAWNAADKAGFELGKQQGMEVITLTDAETSRWEKQCASVTESWIAGMEAKGYPGRKFVESAKRDIRKYNKEFGSWQD